MASPLGMAALGAVCLTVLGLAGPRCALAVAAAPAGPTVGLGMLAGSRPAATAARGAAIDPPAGFWQAVAARVGVSPEALQRAVRDVRAQSMGARRQAFAARLAEKLGGGITGGQVLAAFDQARRQAVSGEEMLTAVAKRLGVTPAALRTALIEAAPRCRWLGAGLAGRHPLGGVGRYLGMTPKALAPELGKGTSPAHVAEGRGEGVVGLKTQLGRAAARRIHVFVRTPCPTGTVRTRRGASTGRGPARSDRPA